jgi:hypothetical protein
MAIRIPTVRASDDDVVFRLEESNYSHAIVAAGAPVRFGQSDLGNGGAQAGPGAIGTYGTDPTEGRKVLTVPSAGARVVRHGGGVRFPLEQRFSVANSIQAQWYGRPLRQYSVHVPIRVTVPGTAQVVVALAQDNGLMSLFSTNAGLTIESDPAVAGGALRCRYRQVNAGAITELLQTAVIPTNWVLVGFRYTERVSPLIEYLVNGVPVAALTGDANMPTLGGAATGFEFGYGVNLPAGTTFQAGGYVYEVRNFG